MFAALHNQLRIESHTEGDELVTQVFLGDVELDADRPLRDAVLAFVGGSAGPTHTKTLIQRGVLAPPPHDPVPETLQLRRNVRLEPVAVPQVVRVAGADGPLVFDVRPESFAVEAWVPRHWLGPMRQLLDAVRSALAIGAGPAELQEVVKAVLEDLPALGDFIEIDGDRLVPLVSLQGNTIAYDLHVSFWGDRNAFLSRTLHRYQLRVTPDRFATIGCALALLETGVYGLDLKEVLAEDRGGKQMVLAFIGRGMVAEVASTTEWKAGTHYLGDGSLYEHGVAGLWIDPVFPVGSVRDAQGPAIPRAALHLFTRPPTLSTLFRLPRETPCVVAVAPGQSTLRDRSASLLRSFGFTVAELDVGSSYDADGVRIEHLDTGVFYTIGGKHTLIGRNVHTGNALEVDRLFCRRDITRVGEHLQGLFRPISSWPDLRNVAVTAVWESVGCPADWWLIAEESAHHSRTRTLLDSLARGAVPVGAHVAQTGPLPRVKG